MYRFLIKERGWFSIGISGCYAWSTGRSFWRSFSLPFTWDWTRFESGL